MFVHIYTKNGHTYTFTMEENADEMFQAYFQTIDISKVGFMWFKTKRGNTKIIDARDIEAISFTKEEEKK